MRTIALFAVATAALPLTACVATTYGLHGDGALGDPGDVSMTAVGGGGKVGYGAAYGGGAAVDVTPAGGLGVRLEGGYVGVGALALPYAGTELRFGAAHPGKLAVTGVFGVHAVLLETKPYFGPTLGAIGRYELAPLTVYAGETVSPTTVYSVWSETTLGLATPRHGRVQAGLEGTFYGDVVPKQDQYSITNGWGGEVWLRVPLSN